MWWALLVVAVWVALDLISHRSHLRRIRRWADSDPPPPPSEPPEAAARLSAWVEEVKRDQQAQHEVRMQLVAEEREIEAAAERALPTLEAARRGVLP